MKIKRWEIGRCVKFKTFCLNLFYVLFKRSYKKCAIKKGVPENLEKFTGKNLCQGLLFNKDILLKTFIKTRLWHRRFPVNFAKYLRRPFLTEHFRWLLLNCYWCHPIMQGFKASRFRRTKLFVSMQEDRLTLI